MAKITELLILCTVAISPVWGTVIVSTGFENPPYTLGVLPGQNGWTSDGPAAASTVENTVVQSGSQAVQISSALQSGATGIILASPSLDSIIEVSADLRTSSSSSTNGWQFGFESNTGAFIGGINFGGGGTFNLITLAFPRTSAIFTLDAWHHVDFLMNFASQSYSFSLDGTMVAANVAFCGDNGTCLGEPVGSFRNGIFDTFAMTSGRNDFGYIDNYSVIGTATPEPASFMFIGCGLSAFTALWTTKRRVARRRDSIL